MKIRGFPVRQNIVRKLWRGSRPAGKGVDTVRAVISACVTHFSPGPKARGIFLRRYNSRVTGTHAFKDHFSGQSAAYERHRPAYPPALFAWLATVAPRRALAIDVATGNGQAAIALAGHFDSVIATEPSAAQLARAREHPRVAYRQEAAEAISVAAGTADLLTAAQAAHWFDWPRFVAEAARVLRPGGICAIWTYGDSSVDAAVDDLIGSFSRDLVGPYWPRERRHVEEGYRDLVLPLAPVEAPPFEIRLHWDLAAMLGYLDTWSSVRRARARTGRDPLALLAAPLAAAWGEAAREVRWPIALRAGRA
jgi:SAM-dependent methyltransferase